MIALPIPIPPVFAVRCVGDRWFVVAPDRRPYCQGSIIVRRAVDPELVFGEPQLSYQLELRIGPLGGGLSAVAGRDQNSGSAPGRAAVWPSSVDQRLSNNGLPR